MSSLALLLDEHLGHFESTLRAHRNCLFRHNSAYGRLSFRGERKLRLSGFENGTVDSSGDNAEYSIYFDARVRFPYGDTLVL